MTDAVAATAGTTSAPHGVSAWHDPSGFGFRDILDIVNPLQHLPIIGSIYRWLTGDHPGVVAKIAGDALYGGPIGAAVGFASAVTEDDQGHDLGERALAAVFHSDAKTTAIADATPASPAPAPAPVAMAAAAPAVSPAPPPAAPPAANAAPTLMPLAHADHAPIPLFGGIAQPTPPLPEAAAPSADPARALMAHNANVAREISAGSRPAPASKPVPLVLPAGAITPPRPLAPQGPAAQGAAAQGTATAPTPPLDVSQKMMDALDKYMRLEQERKGQGSATAPTVDLSL